jgi:DNA-binding FrmR family transcriptional regulator
MMTVTTTNHRVDRHAVVNRVKRAQGQLAGVLRMIEEDRDVTSVLNQIKAVSSALDRAGFAIVASEWRDSVDRGEGLSEERVAELERLFLSLS